jgi:nucleoside-diphosphate-sugar epimerase
MVNPRPLRNVVGFTGEIRFDDSKPDGTPRKRLDVSRLAALGWTAGAALRYGQAQTSAWFLDHPHQLRKGP